MTGFEAHILEEPLSWSAGFVRLQVVEHLGGGTAHWLASDGTWRTITAAEASTVEGRFGIELPRASIEAIAVAIAQWQGHASHADTEARVLREWLAVESRRVDEALKR